MPKGLPGEPITDPDLLAVLGDNLWTYTVIRWVHNKMHHLPKPVIQDLISMLKSADFQVWYVKKTKFKLKRANLVPHEVGQTLERQIGKRHESDENPMQVVREIYRNLTKWLNPTKVEAFAYAHWKALKEHDNEEGDENWTYVKQTEPYKPAWKAINHVTYGFGSTMQLARVNAIFTYYFE